MTVRVLVADDSLRMRELIRDVLTAAAHEVIECADGAAAVAACERERPDVTVMDLEMPGMDGLAATQTICARMPGARVLILTAFDSGALRLAAQQAGAAGYALKSDLRHLTKMIDASRSITDVPPNSNL